MQQQIHEREQANEGKPPAVAHSEWFFPVRNKPGWFNFAKFIPIADAFCWVIPNGDDIEIHNVSVVNPEMRRQGIGTEMIGTSERPSRITTSGWTRGTTLGHSGRRWWQQDTSTRSRATTAGRAQTPTARPVTRQESLGGGERNE